MNRALLSAFVLSAFFSGAAVHADNTETFAELQVVMQRHIDSILIDGAMHSVDFETGEVRIFYPTDAHTMIMGLGDDFVLCSDLTNKEGKSVPVDFYITETSAGFTVYQTEIDNRAPLTHLIKQGRVERIR